MKTSLDLLVKDEYDHQAYCVQVMSKSGNWALLP